MHPFDASLAMQAVQGDSSAAHKAFSARTDGRYRNAIGPFGGWTAALLLKSVLGMAEARGAPLALDAQFMGPIADGDLEVRVACVRQNRSVGFWCSELRQSDRLCAHAQITLSTERTSVLLQDARFPEVPAPDRVPVYANPRAHVPWLDQYVFRPVSGLLFSRAETMDSHLWIRDAEPRALDAIALTAICDTPFPPTWIRLGEQGPVSTVTYSVYYRGNAADFAAAGAGYCLLDSGASLARNGYVDQFTSVWSEGGALLAQTQQLLWFADAG
jgi:acyl-CoA thioesterase